MLLLHAVHMSLTAFERASCQSVDARAVAIAFCDIATALMWKYHPGGNDWNVVRANGALVSFSNPDNATTTVPTWSQRYTAFIKTVRLCLAVSVYDQAVLGYEMPP